MLSLSPSPKVHTNTPLFTENTLSDQPNVEFRAHDLNTKTVLIVEDNDVVSDFLQGACQAYGFHALSASTPDQALEHCRHERNAIHALIADVRLGHFDGFQTAQKLLELCPDMKVILTSGYPKDYLVQAGRLPANLGKCVFLQKPFLPSEILSALGSLRRPS